MKLEDGDFAGARSDFETELALDRSLVATQGAVWKANMAIALSRVGDVKRRQGDLGGALAAYEEQLATLRSLVRGREDAEGRRAVARALERVGIAKSEGGDRPGARAAYDERVSILHDLDSGKTDAPSLRALASALGWTAYLHLMDGDAAGALPLVDEAISLTPDVVWFSADRAHALMLLGRTKEARDLYLNYRGKHARESTTWEKVVLDDFAALRRAGITDPLMDEIEKDFGTPATATK